LGIIRLLPQLKEAAIQAGAGLNRHSPTEGNLRAGIIEKFGPATVEHETAILKRTNRKLGSADHVVGQASALHILPGGLAADAEDDCNFKVAFTVRDKLDALKFSSTEVRCWGGPVYAKNAPRGSERMGADQFRVAQMADW
jgi:hypothetical protein